MLTLRWPLPDVDAVAPQSPKIHSTQTSRCASPVSQVGSVNVQEASRTDDSHFSQHTGNDSSGEEEKVNELTEEDDTPNLDSTAK